MFCDNIAATFALLAFKNNIINHQPIKAQITHPKITQKKRKWLIFTWQEISFSLIL